MSGYQQGAFRSGQADVPMTLHDIARWTRCADARHLALFTAPLAAGALDGVVTLAGQPRLYWQGFHCVTNERDPLALVALEAGPLWFVALGLAWGATILAILWVARGWFAVGWSVAVTFYHGAAAAAWGTGVNHRVLPAQLIVYVLVAGALLSSLLARAGYTRVRLAVAVALAALVAGSAVMKVEGLAESRETSALDVAWRAERERRYDVAEKLYDLAIAQGAAVDTRHLAMAMLNKAFFCERRGRYDEAEMLLERVRLVAASAGDASGKRDIAEAALIRIRGR